jgi:hypothetical protein
MSEQLEKYRALRQELAKVRDEHRLHGSAAQDR